MIGQTIQHYSITRLIGEGGMASVYEAVHQKLQSKVAIKVLNPILTANDGIRQRFENEARFMAGLNHINITRVIDYEERPDMLAIILEFLEGEDMNVHIKRNGAMSLGETKKAFFQVLDAFTYAHSKNIVHRDVKPSNIFIEPTGIIKILDFGIAKLVGSTDEMTVTGAQIGTPVYMSPEQVNSDKKLDHRSDIYSLGVTLYYMLHGKPPYDASTTSNFQIFTKIVYEPLPDLVAWPVINEVIKKATHKDPSSRFQSCADFRTALEEAFRQSETPTSASNFDDDKTLIDVPGPAAPVLHPASAPIPQHSNTPVPANSGTPVPRSSGVPTPPAPSGSGTVPGNTGTPKSRKPVDPSPDPFTGKPARKSRTVLYTALIVVVALITLTLKVFPDFTGSLFMSEAKKAARHEEAVKIIEQIKSEWQKELKQRDISTALVNLEKAVDLDDENPDAWFYYSSALYYTAVPDGVNLGGITKEQISAASDAMEKLIGLKPDYKQPENYSDPYSSLNIYWGELALHFLSTGDTEAALDAYKEGRKRGAFSDALLEYARNNMAYTGTNALLINSDDLTYHNMLYLQQTEGYKPDLKLISLGFLETEWYFSYLKTKLQVPFSGDADWFRTLKPITWQISEQKIETPQGQTFSWFVQPNDKGQLSVREQLLIDILKANQFILPVSFSNFVNPALLVSLGSYLTPEGWSYKLEALKDMGAWESNVSKLEKLSVTNIMGFNSPSTDFMQRIDMLRYNYISLSSYLYDNNKTSEANVIKRLLAVGFPVSNLPIRDSVVKNEYNALLFKTEYTEEQRLAKVGSDIADYMKDKGLTGYTTATGLVFCEKVAGSGSLAAGRKVKANYRMYLFDGTEVYNSSTNSLNEFDLSTDRFIPGFSEGISLMKQGGKATFFIPYNLGYGSKGQSNIPPYSTLVVDMEILEVR